MCVVLCNQSSYARMAIALLMLKETLCFVQAIGIRDLLPDVMETLRFANTSIALKASKISRNVMTHVGKREARPIVVELAEKLLPLFSHVSQLLEAEFCGCMLSLLSSGHLLDIFWALQPSQPCPWQPGWWWWCEAPVLGRSPATVQSIFCQGLLAECRVLPLLPVPGILPRGHSREMEAKQAACAPGALPRTSPVSSLSWCSGSPALT